LVVLLRRGSKAPDGSSWQTTRDARVVRQHLAAGGNVGLVCGEVSGVAVLDFDSVEAKDEMYAALGSLVPWVGSPSHGTHVYVRWAPGLPAKLRWKGKIVGEIQRGPGQQQVVIPPSPYPGNPKRGIPPGGRYEWLTDPTQPLPELPATWLGHLAASEGQFAPTTAAVAGTGLLPRPSFIPDGDSRGTENIKPQQWDGPDATELQRRALQQPGAKLRGNGAVKFQCYGCQLENRDRHMDNARVGPDGRWGCAVDTGHKRAIAVQLGVIRW
jgi:hypothetical protein